MRGGVVAFRERALHLVQFPHEIRFCVESTRGIANQELGIAAVGSAVGVVTNGRRVAVVLPLNDLAADALCPNIELFDGGSAESVGGSEHDAVTFSLKKMGELGRRRCLAGAV